MKQIIHERARSKSKDQKETEEMYDSLCSIQVTISVIQAVFSLQKWHDSKAIEVFSSPIFPNYCAIRCNAR